MTKKQFEDLLVQIKVKKDDKEFIKNAVFAVALSGIPHYIYDLIEYCPEVATKENMRILENAILGLAVYKNRILVAYEFMYEMATDFQIENFDLNRFEEYIIASENPKYISYCILCIKGTNIPRMLKALYNTKNPKYINRIKEKYDHSVNKDLYPAEEIFNDEYYNELEKAKKDTYVPNWVYFFQSIGDVLLLFKRVIENGNPYFATELADYLEYLIEYVYKDDEKIVNALKFLIDKINIYIKNHGTMLDKYEYSWAIKNADIPSMQKDVIESEDPKFMYYFREIPGANVDELDAAINLTGNEKYIECLKKEKRNSGEGNTLSLDPK